MLLFLTETCNFDNQFSLFYGIITQMGNKQVCRYRDRCLQRQLNSFLLEHLIFELRLNVLKLRISVSNVLKMFLNIIVSIGSAVVIFHSYKPSQTNQKHQYDIFVCRYPGRQERNIMINN